MQQRTWYRRKQGCNPQGVFWRWKNIIHSQLIETRGDEEIKLLESSRVRGVQQASKFPHKNMGSQLFLRSFFKWSRKKLIYSKTQMETWMDSDGRVLCWQVHDKQVSTSLAHTRNCVGYGMFKDLRAFFPRKMHGLVHSSRGDLVDAEQQLQNHQKYRNIGRAKEQQELESATIWNPSNWFQLALGFEWGDEARWELGGGFEARLWRLRLALRVLRAKKR